jgi:hypothetical protein
MSTYEELASRKTELKEAMEYFRNNLDEYVDISHYNNELDEQHGGYVTVCGMEFEPHRVLYELDPVAYDEGWHNFLDAISPHELPEYREMMDELEEVDLEIEEAIEQLNELKDLD